MKRVLFSICVCVVLAGCSQDNTAVHNGDPVDRPTVGTPGGGGDSGEESSSEDTAEAMVQ